MAYTKIRSSIMALIVTKSNSVAMVLKESGPEPHCWDLPGGGINPGERLLDALQREVKEETGLCPCKYKVDDILTVEEGFFLRNPPKEDLHSLSIIHRCFLEPGDSAYGTNVHRAAGALTPGVLHDPVPDEPTLHPQEQATKEARWFKPEELGNLKCSQRSMSALRKAGLI